MTLREALDFVNVGNKHILLSDITSKRYDYTDMHQFEESEEYEKLLSSEVINVDADGCDDTVVFYLW